MADGRRTEHRDLSRCSPLAELRLAYYLLVKCGILSRHLNAEGVLVYGPTPKGVQLVAELSQLPPPVVSAAGSPTTRCPECCQRHTTPHPSASSPT